MKDRYRRVTGFLLAAILVLQPVFSSVYAQIDEPTQSMETATADTKETHETGGEPVFPEMKPEEKTDVHVTLYGDLPQNASAPELLLKSNEEEVKETFHDTKEVTFHSVTPGDYALILRYWYEGEEVRREKAFHVPVKPAAETKAFVGTGYIFHKTRLFAVEPVYDEVVLTEEGKTVADETAQTFTYRVQPVVHEDTIVLQIEPVDLSDKHSFEVMLKEAEKEERLTSTVVKPSDTADERPMIRIPLMKTDDGDMRKFTYILKRTAAVADGRTEEAVAKEKTFSMEPVVKADDEKQTRDKEKIEVTEAAPAGTTQEKATAEVAEMETPIVEPAFVEETATEDALAVTEMHVAPTARTADIIRGLSNPVNPAILFRAGSASHLLNAGTNRSTADWDVSVTNTNSSKMMVTAVSMTEEADRLVWTITLNQGVNWQGNNTYHWVSVAEPGSNVSLVDLTKSDGTLSATLGGQYRTSNAMADGNHTYTLVTGKPTSDTANFVLTFRTAQRGGGTPSASSRSTTTANLTAKKMATPQVGQLNVIVNVPQAYTGVAKVSLTGRVEDAQDIIFNNASTANLRIKDLSPGSHNVTFHGLTPDPGNWTVDETPQSATVWAGLISDVTFNLSMIPTKTIQVHVIDTDGNPVSGVKLSLTDNEGTVHTGTTVQDGMLTLDGMFTKNTTYPVTIDSVPTGYRLPNQSVGITYHPKADNPTVSTVSTVVIEKSDFNAGELSLGTNAESDTISLEIYQGKDKVFKESVEVPAGIRVKLDSFIPYEKYTVKVISSSNNLYETGGETSFIYDPSKPFVDVFLKEKMATNHQLTVRFHEKDVLGPLTQRLEGQTLTLRVNGSVVTAMIQNGMAIFPNPAIGTYEIAGTDPSTPGYQLVKNSPFKLTKDSGYQDWVLRKATTTVYLNAKPPEGKSFPADMTVKIVDVATGMTVSGPKSIGDGLLLFDGLTPDKDYNIVYENVAINWTHAHALATPFHIPAEAVETAISDQFGYYDPASDQTQFSVKVVDKQQNPVDGFTFVIKDAQGQIVPNSSITTGMTGEARTVLPKLAPGLYTVENTVAKIGYGKVQIPPVTITAEEFNIEAEVTTAKDTMGNTANIDITLKDSKSQPVASQWLSLYKIKGGVETLVTSQLQTDSAGETFIMNLPVDAEARYEFRLTEPTIYELVSVAGESNDIILQPGVNRRFDLKLQLKPGVGKITGTAMTADNEPVPNLLLTVKKQEDGKEVDSFRTYNNGKNDSQILPYGIYTVTLTETAAYKLVAGEAATKTVIIDENNKNPVTAFIVEKKTYEVGNAGSIQVEGTMIKDKDGITRTSWVATVEKAASDNALTKRKANNKLTFPANQMMTPSQPTLMRKIGDGNFMEIPLDGTWIRKGDVYEFTDTNNRVDEWTAEKVVYQYSFTAVGIDTATVYEVTAEADIASDNPAEVIRPVDATHTLQPAAAQPALTLNGSGGGQVDTAVEEVEWNYDGQVDALLPGKLTFILSRPSDGSGIKPFNKIIEPVVTTFDKSGKPTNVPYEIIYDPSIGVFKIIFDTRAVRHFDFHVRLSTDVNHDESVSEFKLDTEYLFEGEDLTPEKHLPLTLTAAKTIPLPGKTAEMISACADGRHKVNLHGMVSADGKYIRWQAKVTNLDAKEVWRPMRMNVHVGEGLGDAELVSINSVGKSFPFVTKGTTTNNGPVIYDQKEPHKAGKDFRVHTEYTDHFLRGRQNEDATGEYHYIDRRQEPFPGIVLNSKKDPQGNDYYFYIGFTLDPGNVSQAVDQHLRPGDYVQFSFDTPITDFSRMQQGAAGYTVDIDTTSHDTKPLSSETGAVKCQSNTSLTLRREPFSGDIIPVRIYKTEVAEIYAQGKYINDGKDIEWSIEAQPLRKKKLLESNTQDLKIEYQLVNSDNQPYNTGLGPIHSATPKKIEIGPGFTYTGTHDATSGVLTMKSLDLGESLKYTFVTPVTEEKPEYRLEVKGYYANNEPLTDANRPGEHVSYVIVTGKTIEIRVNKKWDNVYDNAEKPDIKLYLTRQKISGEMESVTSMTVQTPKAEKYIEAVFDKTRVNGVDTPLPRFDENGFRYNYGIREEILPGYRSNIIRLNGDGSLWQITNVKDDVISTTTNPIDYTNGTDGRYPTSHQQDGPDIRNADTKALNEKGENYKIDYEDAVIGKSGQQTDVPGMFDMKLTVEGKSKGSSQGVDVVFVLDNSHSMTKAWDSPGVERYEERTKIYALRKTMEKMLDQVLLSPNNRAGIINFGTSTRRKNPGVREAGYKRIPADGSSTERVDMLYNRYDYAELTSSRAKLYQAIPTAAHYVPNLGVIADGTVDVTNRSHADTNIAAGIAEAGDILYPKGETGKRKKIMIVISDGMPTASLKLKRFPLDPTQSLKNNLVPTGMPSWDTSPYSGYIMCNNVYYLMGFSYQTENGRLIDNNALSAIAVSDYLQKRDANLEIFSVGIGKKQVDHEFQGNNTHGVTESSSVLMERTLRSITTNYNENYYEADDSDALLGYLNQLEEKFKANSIINGEIVDPMGKQVNLRVAHGFKPASSEALVDGDYYLSDNFGNYMDADGIIKNKNGIDYSIVAPTYHRDTYLKRPTLKYPAESYKLDTFGQPLMVHDPDTGVMIPNADPSGLYRYILVTHEQKTTSLPNPNLPYTNPLGFKPIESLAAAETAIKTGKTLILLRNTDSGSTPFISDVGIGSYPKEQAPKSRLTGVTVRQDGNGLKVSGLNLGTNEEVTLRYRINLRTEDKQFVPQHYYPANLTTTLNPRPEQGSYYRYFPLPSVKGPVVPMEIRKKWVDRNGNDYVKLTDKDGQPITSVEAVQALQAEFERKLKEAATDSISVQIYQYRAKVDVTGALINESGQPLGPDEQPVADPATKRLLREEVITAGTSEPHWANVNNDLPAYDNEGRLYIYDIEEAMVPAGFEKTAIRQTLPKAVYDKENGFRLVDTTGTDGRYEFEITNRSTEEPKGRFEILKTDFENTGLFLPGATFQLKKDGVILQTKITGEQGTTVFDELIPGRYVLEETVAPDGYQLDTTKQYDVLVEETGDSGELQVTLTHTDKNGTVILPFTKPEEAGKPNRYMITNRKLEIPFTGRLPGESIFLLLGVGILLLFVRYVYKVNKEKGG
ncbi:MAG: SpaA isopeptide-forming pilin-related protein [Eubacteriales bacterium]|nr:SpaA isopeptide-forming pilin-related protein [Eubacteriales bacterium]